MRYIHAYDAERQWARSDADGTAGPMTAGLVGTSGFAAIPTTALDLPLVQRLRRSARFRVRVPIANDILITG